MNLIRLPLTTPPLLTLFLVLLLTSSLIIPLISHAKTSIWQVSDGKNTVYLGGTFHMLKPSDYPLPIEFEQVYNKVNWLVFETDIMALKNPEFQQYFQHQMKLPSGQILADQLSANAYGELIRYMAKNNLDIGQYQSYRPQMIGLIINILELNKLGLTAQGVDDFFGEKAISAGKILSQLESKETQAHYLASMAKGNESNFILQTLEDSKNLAPELAKLSQAWRSGDIQALYNTGVATMIEDYPSIYQSLLVERNRNWLPTIETLIQQPEEKLILVGALHLAGPEGLLEQLKKKGYRVQHYLAQDP